LASTTHTVDVRAREGDAAVVQYPEGVGQFVESLRHELFADRTAVPRSGALRVVGKREDQPAELRVALADALFPVALAALELAARGCASGPGLRRSTLTWTLHATDGP
jgi:hypothetical protein